MKHPIKHGTLFILLTWLICGASLQLQAQTQEVQQLVLNVEKLRQLKQILKDMEKGYRILSGGYNAVRDISRGNFSLHDLFLQGLLKINPTIAKYQRIADMLSLQKRIMQAYSRAKQLFYSSGGFSPEECRYMLSVYGRITERCLRNMEELMLVTTASRLRMRDEERLEYIDMLYGKTREIAEFVRYFNHQARLLGTMRKAEAKQVSGLQHMYSQEKEEK